LEIQHDRGLSLLKKGGTLEGRRGERLQAAPGGSNIRFDAATPASLCGQQFDAQLEAFVDCNKMDYSRLEIAFDGGANGTKRFMICPRKCAWSRLQRGQNLAPRNPRG